MLQDSHSQVLFRLKRDLRRITWALTGSGALALHGLPIEPNDLDLRTDEAGAYEIASRFSDEVVESVYLRTSELIRSHFGVLRVDGVQVEIMVDMELKATDGSWPGAPDLAQNSLFVDHKGEFFPVMTLQSLRNGYLRLGRQNRVDLIERFLRVPPELNIGAE